jgi:hypothetical protein
MRVFSAKKIIWPVRNKYAWFSQMNPILSHCRNFHSRAFIIGRQPFAFRKIKTEDYFLNVYNRALPRSYIILKPLRQIVILLIAKLLKFSYNYTLPSCREKLPGT